MCMTVWRRDDAYKRADVGINRYWRVSIELLWRLNVLHEFKRVQYWSLLNWRIIQFHCGSIAVLVNWLLLLCHYTLLCLKNVVHKLEPDETPSNSASHQAPNHLQRSSISQNTLKCCVEIAVRLHSFFLNYLKPVLYKPCKLKEHILIMKMINNCIYLKEVNVHLIIKIAMSLNPHFNSSLLKPILLVKNNYRIIEYSHLVSFHLCFYIQSIWRVFNGFQYIFR